MRTPAFMFALLLTAGAPIALQAQEAAPVVAPKAAVPKMEVKKAGLPPVTGKVKAKAKTAKPVPQPAKELFGAAKTPAPLAARAIGFYAKGCLAGGTALPIDGPAWQAMRLSRNRNWGHPALVATVEKLALDAKKQDGWPGLLVGDLSQPRGGPMLTGHASHQVGLDADIWLTPMPDRRLTEKEREELSAISMLAADKISVDPGVWTAGHVKLIRRAASYAAVERIFVHPAIKKALCAATEKDADRKWLSKVRPMWGHHYHFHVRIVCPNGSSNCEHQPAPPEENGCGKELTDWLALVSKPPKPEPPGPPAPPKPQITLDQLPTDCRAVLASGTTPSSPPAPAPAKSTKAIAAKKTTETK